MRKKLINSQLNNIKTYNMYFRQCMTLAENVFKFNNLPIFIDVSFMNKTLIKNGAIAFFYDDVLETVLALPFIILGNLDVYGRPLQIQAIGQNGYSRILKKDEFVIMYDNNGQYPIYLDICQYAERLALDTMVSSMNISQQKTPRFWKTSANNERTIKDIVNNVDGLEESIITYKNINLDDTSLVLAPAPFVSDKIDLHKDKIWNEFLRFIGVANLSFQKKERNISDEIQAMQGGTIASRFSRFEPRKRAVELINEKFGQYLDGELSVEYYDSVPSTNDEESEGDKNEILQ